MTKLLSYMILWLVLCQLILLVGRLLLQFTSQWFFSMAFVELLVDGLPFYHQSPNCFWFFFSPFCRHRACRFLPSFLSEYLFICSTSFHDALLLIMNIVLSSSKMNLVQIGHIVCLSPCSYAFWTSWQAITRSSVCLSLIVSAFISP